MAIKLEEFFDPNLGSGAQLLAEFTASIQGLKRNYAAFAKNLEADGGRVKAALADISTQGGQLAGQIGALKMATEQERVVFAALDAQIVALRGEQVRLQQQLAEQAKAQQVVNDATKQAQSASRALQNELRQAYAAGDTARITAAATAIRTAKTETTALSQALRGTNSELTAARGSYDALDAQNKRLIATLKALDGGLGGNEQRVAALQNQIAQNTAKLREFDENILVFTRNVGNYAGGFSQLVAELAKARAAQAGMSEGTQQYALQQQRIVGFQTAAQKSAAQMGLSYEQAEAKLNSVGEALRPLATRLTQLEREQLALAASTGTEGEEYRKLGFQIQSAKKQLDDVATSTAATETKQASLTQQLGFTREGLTQYALGLAASTVGVAALVQASQALFRANVDYSRNLAEVRKTTGLTADEAERLADSLEALDSPTNLAGLLKIAAVGGQLGEQGVADVLAFTKAIDTAVQALSNDFTGGAEEIATVLGKIGSVYRRELGPDRAQNILAVGSAVNQLGADGAATAPFLTDVALRVGALSASTRVGLPNVLAYAAVLQETGSTSEVAGTALNRFFSTLTTRTKAAYEIAKLANPALTLKEFNHLVNTDFNQAIQVFLRGLREGGKSTTDQARLLATLKLQSGEAKNAIVTLAQNTELYTERQQTANQQLREATSLGKEAAINTETLAGSYDKLKNNATQLVTGGALAGILKFLVDFVAFDLNLLAAGFRGIGDAFVYVGEKVGLVDKPLTDYTASMVENALGARKQAAAQQELLKSYTDLAATTGRSSAQELALAQARAELIRQFGTDEVAAIQARIAAKTQEFERGKQQLQDEVSTLGALISGSQADVSRAREAANEQDKKLTSEQIDRARQLAIANRNVPANALSDLPQMQAAIAANQRLAASEGVLTEQQRQRALAQAALAKLGDGATQQKLAEANASEEAQKHEEKLGRTERENARDRVAILRDRLEDNKRAIQEARDYQAEQGKLFADQQISYKVLEENIAGSEDLIAQKQRDGLAIRKLLIRAEAASQVEEAQKSRDNQLREKGITENEITDIQGEYSRRRKEIARIEKRAILQAEKDLQKDLAVAPLEFKVPKVNIDQLTADLIPRVKTYQDKVNEILHAGDAQESLLSGQLVRGEITQNQYDRRSLANKKKHTDEILALDKSFHQTTIEDQIAANKDILERQKESDSQTLEQRRQTVERNRAIIDKAAEYAQFAEQSFFQIKGNLIDKQIQDENAAYENSIKVAGDNAELKEKIEKDHQKRLAKLNYDKAKAERDGALFSIAINTAAAVAKEIATYTFAGALPFIAADLALGAVQAAVVLSKPLPQYFKGREGGPAELAIVGDRGPEFYGQANTGFKLANKPTVVQLQQHDVVYTAPQTRDILAQQAQAVERIQYRTQQADLQRTTELIQRGAAQQQAAILLVQRADTQALIGKLDWVGRLIQQQEYYRLNEQDDMVRRSHKEQGYQDRVNKRYRPNAPKQ